MELQEERQAEDRYCPELICLPGYEDQPLVECGCGCWTVSPGPCEECRAKEIGCKDDCMDCSDRAPGFCRIGSGSGEEYEFYCYRSLGMVRRPVA